MTATAALNNLYLVVGSISLALYACALLWPGTWTRMRHVGPLEGVSLAVCCAASLSPGVSWACRIVLLGNVLCMGWLAGCERNWWRKR